MKDLDENDLKLWKEDEKKAFPNKITHSHPHDHDHHHTHGHDKIDEHKHKHEHIIKMWGDERGYTIVGDEDDDVC